MQDVSAEEIDRIFSVNVRGVFLSYKYAANQMIKQGKGGKLIAASSIGGFKLQKLLTPYCATKVSWTRDTKQLYLELYVMLLPLVCRPWT